MTPHAPHHRNARRLTGVSLALALIAGTALTGCAGPSDGPSTAGPLRYYTVAAGDTVYGISRRTNVPVRALIEENRLTPPFVLKVGQVLRLPEQRQHVVARGETVYGIAKHYGINMNQLARRNALGSDFVIKVGQVLLIPGPDDDAAQIAAAESTTRPTPAPAGRPAPAASSSGGGGGVVSVPLAPPPSAPASSSSPAASSASSAPPPLEETVVAESPRPAPVPPAASPSPGSFPTPPARSSAPAADPVEEPSAPTAAPVAPPPAAASEPAPAAPPPVPPPSSSSKSGGGGGGLLQWPIQGTILSAFGPAGDRMHNDGINIAASQGTVVRAAEAGTVAYAGNEIRGFGNLLLIKHEGGLMTAYAHNSSLLVTRGQAVRRGQEIARVGATGGVARPQLHFEVRKNGKPVDPMPYLRGQKVAMLGSF